MRVAVNHARHHCHARVVEFLDRRAFRRRNVGFSANGDYRGTLHQHRAALNWRPAPGVDQAAGPYQFVVIWT
jgi:hypothetical protein